MLYKEIIAVCSQIHKKNTQIYCVGRTWNLLKLKLVVESRGGAFGWGNALQAGRSRGSIPDGVIGFFHWHNLSGRTMALGSTQPLTEMSTRK
jgi:hypothetical protein